MLPDGFHDVPRGRVATVVTHLEMRARPAPRPCAAPEGYTLRRVEQPEPEWYRDLFLRVGGMDWLWFSRLRMSEEQLLAILHDPGVQVFALERDGLADGLLELDFRTPGDCEIAFFGVGPALLGSTAGRFLMTRAIATAFDAGITRLHVHTCTLDHPRALGFYLRSGFTALRQQVEIQPDPRLTGDLPDTAAPQIPIFR
ncbi:MAG: GNAT family N-acetyltransferase [Pseudooceanicola sp.]|nr:GNAT family N-acetyltransferase [Pseudooceanicola sp.]